MKKENEYMVTLFYTESSMPKSVTVEVTAKSEAGAIEKAKLKLSIDREGKNYQVVTSGDVIRK